MRLSCGQEGDAYAPGKLMLAKLWGMLYYFERERLLMKKTLKKAISVALCVVMLVMIASTAVATSVNENEKLNAVNVLDQLTIIDFGREIEFFSLKLTSDMLSDTRGEIVSDNLLHFESLEEFERFVLNFIAWLDEPYAPEYIVHSYENANLSPRSFSTINDEVRWWSGLDPFSGGTGAIMLWKHIQYSFSTNGRTVQSPAVTGSSVSGVQVGFHWTHRFGNAHISNSSSMSSTINLSATGDWFIGASVGGGISLPIGVNIPDTWTRTVTIWHL